MLINIGPAEVDLRRRLPLQAAAATTVAQPRQRARAASSGSQRQFAPGGAKGSAQRGNLPVSTM